MMELEHIVGTSGNRDEIFLLDLSSQMWTLLNLYISKIAECLEGCGIELLGKGNLRDISLSPNVDIGPSLFSDTKSQMLMGIVNWALRNKAKQFTTNSGIMN